MQKRGLSHIEVIVSFVLFLGFIIFALIFFNPLDTTRVVDSSLFYAMDEVSDNISVSLISYSVDLKNAGGNVVAIPINNPEGYKVRVETNSGNRLPAKYENGNVLVNKGANNFLVVKFSEVFDESESVGVVNQPLSEGDFVLSSSSSSKVWSEKRASELKAAYDQNYLNLKKEFNIPGRVEFGFIFQMIDEDEIVSKQEIPDGLDVFSKSDRKEAISLNGDSSFADLTALVW